MDTKTLVQSVAAEMGCFESDHINSTTQGEPAARSSGERQKSPSIQIIKATADVYPDSLKIQKIACHEPDLGFVCVT